MMTLHNSRCHPPIWILISKVKQKNPFFSIWNSTIDSFSFPKTSSIRTIIKIMSSDGSLNTYFLQKGGISQHMRCSVNFSIWQCTVENGRAAITATDGKKSPNVIQYSKNDSIKFTCLRHWPCPRLFFTNIHWKEHSSYFTEVFFPSTSPWMTAFLVITFCAVAVIAAAGYKLKSKYLHQQQLIWKS